ncbi:MAG: hypothetical protein NO515_00165 [Candidatus Methanomethylicia archaeon]|nr:hypothetical protein [Candidatus Methanomethylicia archaeon]MCQ5373424.1 hypothetical protein [Candidatus Methanomethylicia archaeon]
MKNLDRSVIYGLIIALVFVAIGTFFLYESNETLDMVAEHLGFVGENIIASPFPEYTIPGFDNVWASLALGMISTIIIFAVAYGIGKLIAKIRTKSVAS